MVIVATVSVTDHARGRGGVLRDPDLLPTRLPAAIVTFFVGVGCFAALGLLVAGLVNSGEGATAVTNATLLPLAFISGVFIIPSDDAPAWLDTVANIFPLKHFVVPFTDAFNPTYTGPAFQWDHLGLHGVVG